MVVAGIALLVALVGTAVAGPVQISFNKQEKKQVGKIARKVANKRITKKAPKLAVKSAGKAAKAADAQKLGGLAPGGYQARVRWALIAPGGKIISQSGGITAVRTAVGILTSTSVRICPGWGSSPRPTTRS